MARKVETKEINGSTYEVTQFGALVGRQVLLRLTKMIGPALAGLSKGGFNEQGLASALETWTANLSPDDFDYLCDQFAKCTKVKQSLTTGQVIDLDLDKQFDSHFAGNYGTMILWLRFAIGVNYSSFLGEITSGLGDLLGALGIRKASGSKSPPE